MKTAIIFAFRTILHFGLWVFCNRAGEKACLRSHIEEIINSALTCCYETFPVVHFLSVAEVGQLCVRVDPLHRDPTDDAATTVLLPLQFLVRHKEGVRLKMKPPLTTVPLLEFDVSALWVKPGLATNSILFCFLFVKTHWFAWRPNQWPLIGETLFSSLPPSNSLVSVSCVASGTTEIQGHPQVWRAGRGGPRTLSTRG